MPSVEPDYYEVLQIRRDASVDDIRKSYRKLAIKYHPDKNPEQREASAEEFKKISAAYEVLSDPEKRSAYDRYGSEGASRMGREPSGFHDFQHAQDIFEMFFRDFGGEDFGFNNRGFSSRNRSTRERGFHSSFMDDDDFFGGHFASMDRMFSSMNSSGGSFGSGGFSTISSSSSSSFSGGGGVSKSVSSTTTIENGRRVTKTTTTVRHADGRVETTSNEQTGTAPPTTRHYIDYGGREGEYARERNKITDRRVVSNSRKW